MARALGRPIGTFSLAGNEKWKDAEGDPHERVEWFRNVCFGQLAEVCGESLNKARHLLGRPATEPEVGRP
jgi:single-stranded DNA-binding protein